METARFLFVVFIYMSHCISATDRAPFDFGGESGVAFFFVLSGFVLSLGYGQHVNIGTFGTRKFMLSHVSRLYPLHLLTMMVAIALDSRIGLTYTVAQIVPNVLLIHTWLASDQYVYVANGVSWFLCNIVFFYVVFACLYRLIMRLRVRTLCLFVFAIVAVYVLLALKVPTEDVNYVLYSHPMLRVIDFSLGIVLCRFYQSECSMRIAEHVKKKGTMGASSVELAMVAVLFGAWMVYDSLCPQLRCALLFWPVMPLVVYVLAVTNESKGCIARLFKLPLLMWLGSISFEFYLVHLIMMRTMQHILHLFYAEVADIHIFIAAFFASIVVAVAAKRWFVEPIYKQVKKAIS